jgi:eukaryotic-like serine/threonine-protein kinase
MVSMHPSDTVIDAAAECFDEQTIAAFVGGSLPATRLPSIEAHLAECSVCRAIVAGAAHGALEDTNRRRDRSSGDDDVSAGEGVALPPLEVGGVIAGKYRVEQRLGSGGMGMVFAARHVELGQRVAIKVLHRRGEAATARFLREARTCARLASDHISRVFDVGRLSDGAPYIVMEYLVGEDLGRVVARGPVAITDAVRYVLDACAALAEAHAAGIIHRDLKPANLFLTARSDGRPVVKVLDFGISKSTGGNHDGALPDGLLTSTGTMLGSPLYMSPEQIRARKDVDARTDIWSLGVILYELLAGRQPFRAPTLAAAAVTIAVESPVRLSQVRPELPTGLEAVVLRCLEKEPAARFQTIEALAAALRPLAVDGVATPDGAVPRRRYYRRPATWIGVGVAVVVVGATAVLNGRAPDAVNAPRQDTSTPAAPAPPSAAAAPRAPAAAPGVVPPSSQERTIDGSTVVPQPTKRRRPARPGPLDTPD